MRLAGDLPWSAGVALAGVLVASALLTPASLFARRLLRPPASDRLTWAGMLFMGLFSSLLVLTLLRDLVLLAARLGAPVPAGFDAASAAAVPLLALAFSAIGYANARRTARVVRVHIPLPGLDPALEGFRIVQVTDIHVGPTIKQHYLQAIVDPTWMSVICTMRKPSSAASRPCSGMCTRTTRAVRRALT